ncbi:cell division protein ZapA [Sphingomonas sp. Leaf62]|uniref:cell division protein ZapA n=1 Tax=Sphingomonas sp. Leaf62 TaxID=1736228 RepID=UPI0006FFE05D|nr:cell division protein ZapA [Sphingomonas sp. Leaf62]KQN70861.1 hypothetical protein ASE91_06660 [Sphingomonas sp. Leaf62]
MGQIALNVAGREYQVGCRDGEEPKLRGLATMLERHADAAQRAARGSTERTLLYIALMIADELADREASAAGGQSATMLTQIAERLEMVASALEESPSNP